MSLCRCVFVAGTAPSQSQKRLRVRDRTGRSQLQCCPSVQLSSQMHRQCFLSTSLSPPLFLSLTLSTNRAMMKAMDKVFDLYSVFVITCAAQQQQLLFFCSSLFVFFFLLFFLPLSLSLSCSLRRLWNAFMPIQCILLVAACPHHHHPHCPLRSVPFGSVRLSSVPSPSPSPTLCVDATNVCLRKPFRAF